MQQFLLTLAAVVAISVVMAQSVQAQKRIDKSSPIIGYAYVTSNATSGHISVGLPMAERVTASTMSGWVGFYPVQRTRPTSVSEELDQAPKPQPNPATTAVLIPSILQGASVSVVDAEGKPVSARHEFTEGGLSIDTSDLPSGTYSVVTQTKRSASIFRFVVSR